jgi:hypothetical protein
LTTTDKETDKMVYEPYGLTEEEVRIVEQSGFANTIKILKYHEQIFVAGKKI